MQILKQNDYSEKKGENNLKSNENTLLSIAIFLVNRHFLGPDYMWNL